MKMKVSVPVLLNKNARHEYTQWFFITAVLKSEVGGGAILGFGVVESDLIIL